MSKKPAGYLNGKQDLTVQRDKSGNVDLIGTVDLSGGVTVEEMHEATKDAHECVKIIREYFPGTDTTIYWRDAATECYRRFRHHHPDPDNFQTYGSASTFAAWAELCKAMLAIGDYLESGDTSIPSELVERAEKAAAFVSQLEPGKPRQGTAKKSPPPKRPRDSFTPPPPDRRTKPMTKKDAVRLLGRDGNVKAATRWLTECIDDGTYRWEPIPHSNKGYFCVDDDWPEDARDRLKK